MRTWLIVLTAALGGLPARATPAGDPGGAGPGGAELVARVNGEPVTRAELERTVRAPADGAEGPAAAPAEDPAARRRRALRVLVDRRLLLQEARRRGIAAAEEDVDRELVALRRRFPDLTAFGSWMRERGLDDRALLDALPGWIAEARVRAALVEGVRVGDEQVRRYHAQHGDALRVPGDVRLRVIAVRDRAAADEIVLALRRGARFGELARERSQGARARRGGDTGWVDPGKLPEPLRTAVRGLEVGEARGPLGRGDELLVVALAGRRPPRAASLDEARPAIEARLLAAAQQEAIEAWLAARRAAAAVEVLAPSLAGQADAKPPAKG